MCAAVSLEISGAVDLSAAGVTLTAGDEYDITLTVSAAGRGTGTFTQTVILCWLTSRAHWL